MSPAYKRRLESKSERWLLLLAVCSTFLVAGLALWFNLTDGKQDTALAAGSDLRVPLSDLRGNDFRFFTYPLDSSTTVRLLVRRGSDGTIRAAFASCTQCYASRLRHYEWWGQLMCGQCNHAMKITALGEPFDTKKGCVPAPLPYSIETNHIVVRGQTIAEAFQRWYQPASSK